MKPFNWKILMNQVYLFYFFSNCFFVFFFFKSNRIRESFAWNIEEICRKSNSQSAKKKYKSSGCQGPFVSFSPVYQFLLFSFDKKKKKIVFRFWNWVNSLDLLDVYWVTENKSNIYNIIIPMLSVQLLDVLPRRVYISVVMIEYWTCYVDGLTWLPFCSISPDDQFKLFYLSCFFIDDVTIFVVSHMNRLFPLPNLFIILLIFLQLYKNNFSGKYRMFIIGIFFLFTYLNLYKK